MALPRRRRQRDKLSAHVAGGGDRRRPRNSDNPFAQRQIATVDIDACHSPRAGLALLSAARAWALLDERDAVIPEDIQAVLPGVTSHRLQAIGEFSKQNSDMLVRELIEAIAIP